MYWAGKMDRNKLAELAGYDSTNLLNQMLTEKVSFGDKVAEKFEKGLGLSPLWLDIPHFELWPEGDYTDLEFLAPRGSSVAKSIEMLSESDKQELKAAIANLLSNDNK